MSLSLEEKLFQPNLEFNQLALEVFHFQYKRCQTYKDYVDLLKVDPSQIGHYLQIPFLPISLFKSTTVSCCQEHELEFRSSGTTGEQTSKHFIKSSALYKKSVLKGFELFFGKPEKVVFLALLPGYLERPNASLVYMMEFLIEQSNESLSGFYLRDYKRLASTLKELEAAGKPVILFGVTYALLDLLESQGPFNLQATLVFETGGMKGTRAEMPKTLLHEKLKQGFGVHHIYSEYGMTELLSQSYMMGDGKFYTPPWKKVLARLVNDPLETIPMGRNVALNIIDLANLYSCSFIASEDIGTIYKDGFEVHGRMDHSIARGCNLMYSS